MVTLSLALLFISSYALYNTSSKAMLLNGIFENWCKKNKKLVKVIALILFSIPLFLLVNNFGLTSGILFCLMTLICLLKLIIVITPLKIINNKVLIGLLFFTLLTEFFI